MKHTNPVQNSEMQQIKKEEEYHRKERKKVHQKLENNLPNHRATTFFCLLYFFILGDMNMNVLQTVVNLLEKSVNTSEGKIVISSDVKTYIEFCSTLG